MGRAKGNEGYRAACIETRMVNAIDTKDEILASLTEDELIAIKIVWGLEVPEGSYTRDWAFKTVLKISRNRMLALVATYALRENDLNKLTDIMEYLLPKAPRQDKVAVGGDPDAPPVGLEVEAGANFIKAVMGKIDGNTRGLPTSSEKFGEQDLETPESLLDSDKGREGHSV